MIPNLKLTVMYESGATSTVDVRPRSQIAFERQFDIAIAEAFGDEKGLRFEHIYFLAWHASKASQPFDDWLELVENIDMEVDGSADPTPAAPSDGS